MTPAAATPASSSQSLWSSPQSSRSWAMVRMTTTAIGSTRSGFDVEVVIRTIAQEREDWGDDHSDWEDEAGVAAAGVIDDDRVELTLGPLGGTGEVGLPLQTPRRVHGRRTSSPSAWLARLADVELPEPTKCGASTHASMVANAPSPCRGDRGNRGDVRPDS